MTKRLSAILNLTYFKQGDDINRCLVKINNNKIDIKASIENHISMLNESIDILKKVSEIISTNSESVEFNDTTICGDTHMIILTGNENIIKLLAKNDLVDIMDESEDEKEIQDETKNHPSIQEIKKKLDDRKIVKKLKE